MTDFETYLEQVWDDLLSRDPEKIKVRFAMLDPESQTTALAHLTRMTTEPGWHSEQITSAAIALECVSNREY
jgi:hypothetical protein